MNRSHLVDGHSFQWLAGNSIHVVDQRFPLERQGLSQPHDKASEPH